MLDKVLDIPIEISGKAIENGLKLLEGGLTKVDKLAKSIGGHISSAAGGGKSIWSQITSSQNISGLAGGLVGGQSGGGFAGQVGGMIGEAVAGPLGAAIGGQLGPALEKAAPGAMHNLSLVFDDISATLGNTFIPVIEAVTPVLRSFGDILATVLPNADEMRDALGPLLDIVQQGTEDVRKLWGTLGPIVRDGLITSLKIATNALWLLSWPARKLGEIFTDIIGKGKGEGLRSSYGMATRQAQFQSFESYAQSLQQAAFSQPGQSLPSKVDRTNQTLEEIRDILLNPQAARDTIRRTNNEMAASPVRDAFSTNTVQWMAAQLSVQGRRLPTGAHGQAIQPASDQSGGRATGFRVGRPG